MLYLPKAAYRGIRGVPELAQKESCSVWKRAETWQHQFISAQAGKEPYPLWQYSWLENGISQGQELTVQSLLSFSGRRKKLNSYIKLKCFSKVIWNDKSFIAVTKSWFISVISNQYSREILMMCSLEYLHYYQSVFEYIYYKLK